MTLTGKFRDGVIIPNEPLSLNNGDTVTLLVDDKREQEAALAELKKAFRQAAETMDEEWKQFNEMIQRERDEDAFRVARQWRDEGVELAPEVLDELERADAKNDEES